LPNSRTSVQRSRGRHIFGGCSRQPWSRSPADAITKYVIIDMYSKAVQGMPAEDAVKWAHEELGKVYA
jgi:hypothetical protein